MLTKRRGLGRLTLAATSIPLILSTGALIASSETAVTTEKPKGATAPVRIASVPGTVKGAPAKLEADRTLTLESFNKLMKAETNLKGVLERDQNLDRSLAMNGDENARESWKHRLDMKPAVAEAIKQAGLTTRDYVDAYVSVVRASAVAGLQKQGRDVPPSLRKSVPTVNVAFVQSHGAEVEAWWRGSSGSVKPNTMEDLYVAPEDSAKTADKKTLKKPSPNGATSKGDAPVNTPETPIAP